jgi:hypothetical protein
MKQYKLAPIKDHVIRDMVNDLRDIAKTFHNTQQLRERIANKLVPLLQSAMVPEEVVPKCACCGTTENLHRDLGSGGPWRCNSSDCIVF